MPSPTDEQFTQTIRGCARCYGTGHEDLVFSKLTHPMETADGDILASHWSMCPDVNEPIMLRFAEDDVLKAALEDMVSDAD